MIGEASWSKTSVAASQPLQSSRDPTQLAPGFRFHPTDEELVSYYLKRKITGRPIRVDAISEVDLYRAEPWDLPPLSRLQSRDLEWYFFTSLDRKYANRNRTSRATAEGYWKTTGKDRPVHGRSRTIGMKKTLVYHAGRAPRGQRTNWVMHEYRIEDEDLSRYGIQQNGYVVCKIFQKIGAGPQNGAQYGAPFIEEEWEKEEDEDDNHVPVNEARVDALVDPTVRGFVQLGDFLLDQDSGDQQLESLSHPSKSTDEDCSLYIDDPNWKKPISDCTMLADACLSPLQGCKTPLKEPQRKKVSKYQPSSPFEQNYEFVQLTDICSEESTSSILSMKRNETFLDMSNNDSLVDEDSALLNLDGMPSQSFSGQLADANLIYHDAVSHDFVPYAENDRTDVTSFSPLAQLDFLDELMAYYDATEDDLSYPIPSSFEPQLESSACLKAIGSSSLGKQVSAGEKLNASASVDDGSMGGGSNGNFRTDTEHKDCQEKTLTKRLASILDAISAPPAFADEASVISKIVEKTSAAPTGTVRIAAGMIQIQSLTSMDSAECWGIQKHPDMGILLSYDRRKKANGGFISAVCWAVFHLLLLSAVFLVLGYKLGVCAYNL